MNQVTIRWLNTKWEGIEETVARSRVKQPGALEVGMVVNVVYKQAKHKAKIVCTGMPVRTRKSTYRRSSQLRRHQPPPPPLIKDTLATEQAHDGHLASDTERESDTELDLTTPTQPSPTPTTHTLPSPTPTTHTQPSPTPTTRILPSPTPTTLPPLSPTPTTHTQPSPTPTTRTLSSPTPTTLPPLSPTPTTHTLSSPTPSPVPTTPSLPDTAFIYELMRENSALRAENADLRAKVSALEAGPVKRSSPSVVGFNTETVILGCSDSSLSMRAADYREAFGRATTPQDLVLRLVGKAFSDEELARSNVYGGHVFSSSSGDFKEALVSKVAFRAILAQTELEFPGCSQQQSFQRDMRNAVNSKCRRAAFKLRRATAS